MMKRDLSEFGYTQVTSWTQAKDLIEKGWYVIVGGKKIEDFIVSFHLEGSTIKAELFDPPKMQMNYFDIDWPGVEKTYNDAISCGQPMYAKKTNVNMRLKQ